MVLKKIGVVGAGLMGAEIALVFAFAGLDVRIVDTNSEALERAQKRLCTILEKEQGAGRISAEVFENASRNLAYSTELSTMADRDWCIEAVFEDRQTKIRIFRLLEEICRDDCVFSSNTSSISISELSASVSEARRKRFLGTHFFSPVSRMKLVEIISAFDTDKEIVVAVKDICLRANKQPILVKDVVGFAVNRLLHAMLLEATRLVEEGVCSVEDVDKGCRLGLGHPIGPFELMDAVTNGLTLQVQEILHDAYGERFRPRPLMKQMVKAGRGGKIVGLGWYRYPQKGDRQ